MECLRKNKSWLFKFNWLTYYDTETKPIMPYTMKTYAGVDAEIRVFFISALVGGEWSASRPGRFTPEEGATGTRWI
jgi:hypothetical protein